MIIYVIVFYNGYDAPEYVKHYTNYNEAKEAYDILQSKSGILHGTYDYKLYVLDIMEKIKEDYFI